MTNWSQVLSTPVRVDAVRTFARGNLSGRKLYSLFTNSDAGGVVRDGLRTKGVKRLRNASRLALRRRNLL